MQNYLDLIGLTGLWLPIIFTGEVKDFPEVEDKNIGRYTFVFKGHLKSLYF